MDAGGTQHYNGLLLNSRWQVGQNVNLGANWTWSHCIGLPATNIANLEAVYPHQPYQNNGTQDRHLDMGDCTGNSHRYPARRECDAGREYATVLRDVGAASG